MHTEITDPPPPPSQSVCGKSLNPQFVTTTDLTMMYDDDGYHPIIIRCNEGGGGEGGKGLCSAFLGLFMKSAQIFIHRN